MRRIDVALCPGEQFSRINSSNNKPRTILSALRSEAVTFFSEIYRNDTTLKEGLNHVDVEAEGRRKKKKKKKKKTKRSKRHCFPRSSVLKYSERSWSRPYDACFVCPYLGAKL